MTTKTRLIISEEKDGIRESIHDNPIIRYDAFGKGHLTHATNIKMRKHPLRLLRWISRENESAIRIAKRERQG